MSDVELLPKWIMRRYLYLWDTFKIKEFDFDEALSVLSKLPKPDNKKVVALFLSELRKAGWLDVKFDPNDARKRIYKLREYEKMFKMVINATTREADK